MTWRASGVPYIPLTGPLLKVPHTDLYRLIQSELQCWGSSSKGSRDTWGGNELPGIKKRAREVAVSQTEVLAEVIVLFLNNKMSINTYISTIILNESG